MKYIIISIYIILLTAGQVTIAQDANYYYNSGVVFFSASKYSKAISEFNKAIKLDPNYSEAYIYRSISKNKLGASKEAEQDYYKAIGINLTYASAYSNRGIIFYNLGLYPEAIKDFNKAIALDTFIVDAYITGGPLNTN